MFWGDFNLNNSSMELLFTTSSLETFEDGLPISTVDSKHNNNLFNSLLL